jgi:hypothetical protein
MMGRLDVKAFSDELALVAGPCNDRYRTDRDHGPGMIPPADFEAIY